MPPRTPPTAYAAALRLLAMRARAKGELERTLARRGFERPEIEAAISRLSELGYLDDLRFARERALSLLRRARWGGRAVAARLRQHGLTEQQAQRALREAEAELGFDPVAVAREVLERRGLLQGLPASDPARAARLLQLRGFSNEVIAKLLEVEVGEE